MKRLLALFLPMLFCIPAFGTIHEITSLPYTINLSAVGGGAADRNYADTFCLSSNTLSSAGDGLIVDEVNEVVIMRHPDRASTHPYDTVYYDLGTGIEITRDVEYIVVENLAFFRTGSIDDDDGSGYGGYDGIDLRQAHAATLDSCVFHTNAGGDAHAAWITGGDNLRRYNHLFTRCRFIHNGMWFWSRCDYNAAAIKTRDMTIRDTANADFEYHARWEYCRVEDGPHLAWNVSGNAGETPAAGMGVYQIEWCYARPDARNTLYETGGDCQSAANPYAFHMRHVGGTATHRTFIRECTTSFGTNYEGARGIFLENTRWALPTNPIEIVGNVVDCSEGYNAEYNESDDPPVHALRVRYDVGSVRIDSNIFAAHTDTLSSTTYRARNAQLMRFSAQSGQETYTNVWGRDNTLIHYAGEGVPGSASYGIVYDAIVKDSCYVFYNTTITASRAAVLSEFNGGASSHYLYGVNLDFPANVTDTAPIYLGYNSGGYDAYLTVYDLQTADGELDTLGINFSPGGLAAQGAELWRSLDIYAYGNNSAPVVGCTIKVVNAYGDTVINFEETNNNGKANCPVKYWQEYRALTDSTAFNPFTLIAFINGDTTINASFTVGQADANGTDTLTLTSTAGGGSELDQAPEISLLGPQGQTFTIEADPPTDTIKMIVHVEDDFELALVEYWAVTDDGDTIPFGKQSFSGFRNGENEFYDTLFYPVSDSQFLGTFTMYAYAEDTAGSFDQVTGTQNTVNSPDDQPNTNPIVSLITPSGGRYTVGDTAIFHIEVADTVGGLDSVMAWLSIDEVWTDTFYNNGTLAGSPIDLSNTNWTWDSSHVGDVSVVVRAVDDSAGVTVDSSAATNTILAQVSAISVRGDNNTVAAAVQAMGACLFGIRLNLDDPIIGPPIQ